MDYWELVEPIWDTVSIYDGEAIFLEQFSASPEVSRKLLAAHWCQSEICNGGFDQFFFNSTGVLAPEAVEAYRAIGMPLTAAVIEQAMAFFGAAYPRDSEVRGKTLDLLAVLSDQDERVFEALDDQFFDLIERESGGFVNAADSYAEANG